MRKAWLLAVLVVAIAGCEGPSRQGVMDGEADLWEASSNGDAQTLNKLVADDFVGVDVDGSQYDKAGLQRLTAAFRQSGGRRTSDHLKVRVYGDTGIAQGYDHTFHADGTPGPGAAWTDTWIYSGGHWKLVASEHAQMPR